MARRIHAADPARSDRSFSAVRCSALTDSELYLEVFGHLREREGLAGGGGAGIIETVQGGTVYLADIGETSGRFQVDLLCLLESGVVSFSPARSVYLGGARIICGSCESPVELIARGKLRHDLFFRLQVLRMVLPPLRERREDIGVLSDFLVREFCHEAGREVPRIAPEALRVLEEAEWRENVRELKGVLQKALVSLDGLVLTGPAVRTALAEVSAVSGSGE
jgi:DNA-binding NtrC family response regulator